MAKEKAYQSRVQPETVPNKSGGLVFGKRSFMFILIGIGLIFLGLALMSGGHMPSPDVWDESLIYSFRRITLAPIVIILGLISCVYAIFTKD